VLAIQQLKEMAKSGASIARWTIGYFLCTTFIAIVQSALLTGLVWRRLFDEASPDSLSEDSLGDRGTELAETGDSTPVHEGRHFLFLVLEGVTWPLRRCSAQQY
jgi:hypothetical protein